MDPELYISIIIVEENENKEIEKIGLYKISDILQSIQIKFDYSDKNLYTVIKDKLLEEYKIELKDVNDLLFIDHFTDINTKSIIYCFKIDSKNINNKKIEMNDLNILKDIKDSITLANIYIYLKSYIN